MTEKKDGARDSRGRFVHLPPERRACTDCGGEIEDSAPRCPSCSAIPRYRLDPLAERAFGPEASQVIRRIMESPSTLPHDVQMQINALRATEGRHIDLTDEAAAELQQVIDHPCTPSPTPPRDLSEAPAGFLARIEQEGTAQALIGVALGTVCPRCAVRLPLASDQVHVCGVPQEDAPGGAAGVDER